ncbi:MAG: flagellar hook-associated protein FlgK [Pseudomonadota bacterium]
MTADIFGIALSALNAAQRGLTTTGHNIANVNTPSYSRQRVDFESRDPQFAGFGYVGKGVDIDSVRRIADQFLIDQVRTSTSSANQSLVLADLIERIDRQLGDAQAASAVQDFFDALADVNDAPSQPASRQVLLESVNNLVSRLAEQESLLNDFSRDVNRQIGATVGEINELTRAIAQINVDITRGSGAGADAPPNDLLDRRDQLLVELAELVDVQVQTRPDGTLNILVGTGQVLVTGGTQVDLSATTASIDASRTEISYAFGGVLSPISDNLSGGRVGALLNFRDGALDVARNGLGRLAATLSMTLNEQHRDGMDLMGNLGGDLFITPPPQFNALATNTGTITLAYDTSAIGALEASDYRLRHDGTNFVLTRLSDNSVQNLVGAGPFNVDGLTITVGTAPAAGDEYLLQPTKLAPRLLRAAITDPQEIAVARPVKSSADIGNLSNAGISAPEVIDVTNGALLTTTTLVFNDPPTTYQVNGAGPLLAYTAGADIDVNGWRVQISGAPSAGDSFTIESNVGGSGDNGNGLTLSTLQFQAIMDGGTATYQEDLGTLAGTIGASAQQSRISRDALDIIASNAQIARDELSGVNLDEEAANLIRFQQSYQAAAQIVAAADEAFQALIGALRS